MKKAAVAAAGFLLTAVLLTGCQQEKVKELIEPLIADVQTEEESETAQETEEEELSYEIDTSIPIQTGARVAVVSKSTDGEFWNLIRKGMEDAVNAVKIWLGIKSPSRLMRDEVGKYMALGMGIGFEENVPSLPEIAALT